MKPIKIAKITLLSALIAACSYKPITNSYPVPVSREYASSWSNNEVGAYLYGGRTILEFKDEPTLVTIKSAANEPIYYEKIGRRYRLDRRADVFTVWYDTKPVTFTAIYGTRTRVFSANPVTENSIGTRPPPAVKTITPNPPNHGEAIINQTQELAALLELSHRQLYGLRRTITIIGKHQKRPISRWLAVVDERYNTETSATLMVNFPPFGTELILTPELASVVLASAKTAEHINVRGYTDARIAGALDPRIALGRAWSTREYLLGNGIQADKIGLYSYPDGNYIAPSNAQKGRGLNRRVEIEFVDPRIAAIRKSLTDERW